MWMPIFGWIRFGLLAAKIDQQILLEIVLGPTQFSPYFFDMIFKAIIIIALFCDILYIYG